MSTADRVHEDREVCDYLAQVDYLSNCDSISEAMKWQ